MAEPLHKSPDLDDFVRGVMGGKDRKATIRANKCMTCDQDAKEFRDGLSSREYRIGGMCQKCQDATFGSE